MTNSDGIKFVAEPGRQEVVMTRTFDAPRELVFKALTDPEHIPHWWGPRDLKTSVDKMDVRPGGAWRFVHAPSKGQEYAFHGFYHEIVPNERIVNTFEFEGTPGHVMLETVRLEEHDGRTTLTNTSVFQSVADRDGMWQAGMARGSTESMERLAELLMVTA